MIDMNKIKEKANSLLKDTQRTIKQYTPEQFSPEKQYINAMVSSIVLIIIADKVVETDEVTQGIDFIQSLEEIQELRMEKDAIEMFEHLIENNISHIDNEPKWIIQIAKVLGNISLVKNNPKYALSIKGVVEHIAEADSEKEMANKIYKALGV